MLEPGKVPGAECWVAGTGVPGAANIRPAPSCAFRHASPNLHPVPLQNRQGLAVEGAAETAGAATYVVVSRASTGGHSISGAASVFAAEVEDGIGIPTEASRVSKRVPFAASSAAASAAEMRAAAAHSSSRRAAFSSSETHSALLAALSAAAARASSYAAAAANAAARAARACSRVG